MSYPAANTRFDNFMGSSHTIAQAIPRVSVVMTVHNGIAFLREAVQSILAQTYQDFEFIIVDDGSTDGTGAYLETLDDPRIKVLRQPQTGQQVAAHRAILQASAPYIARMDSDDVASPQRLELQVKFLDENSGVGLVGSQITRRGSTGSGLPSHFPTDHDSIVNDLLNNRHSMCNPATVFRRHLYLSIGGYWQHNIAEDWDLFLRLAEVSKLANLDQTLLSYRFHTGSINGRRIVEAQLYNEYAAELARRRQRKEPTISYQEFFKNHRTHRFPSGILFRLDCYSIAQYRRGVAAIHSGKPISGAMRVLFSTICSPSRLVRRVKPYMTWKTS